MTFYSYPINKRDRQTLYVMTNDFKIITYDFPIICTHIHTINLIGDYLLVSVGDNEFANMYCAPHHQIYCTRLLNGGALCDDLIWSDFSYNFKYKSCILFVNFDGEMVFAIDGGTMIYNMQNQILLNDNEEGNSGFQIVAQSSFQHDNECLSILGTWRRSSSFPYACLYAVRKRHIVWKYADNMPFMPGMEWTGFECMNHSWVKMSPQFWPNQNSQSSALLMASHHLPNNNLPQVYDDEMFTIFSDFS